MSCVLTNRSNNYVTDCRWLDGKVCSSVAR